MYEKNMADCRGTIIMKRCTFENAVNDDLKEVHRMVEMLKIDSETTIYCVRLMEKLERSRKEGEARGEAEGDLRRLVTQV